MGIRGYARFKDKYGNPLKYVVIVILLPLFLYGFFTFNNSLDLIDKTSVSVSQILQWITQNQNLPNQLLPKNIPTLGVSQSTDELRQIALDDINQYRQQNNIPPLIMINELPTQTYAELLLSEKCLHHMNDNGLTPQGRFHQAGIDSFAVGENIAGGQKRLLDNQGQFIRNENYDMMFNDAHSNWGHKKNILDPDYSSISLGIAYNNFNMVIVEDFESKLQPDEYIPSSAYFDTQDQKDCW